MTSPITTNRPSSELDQQLANLLAEAVDKLRAGEPVDLSDYVRRYPDFAERLEQLLPAMQALAELGHAPSTVPSSVAGRAGPFEEVRGTLGDFRILREIGRGGMGVVYEAEQISLGRRMALKVLPFASVLDERQLTRFRNESRAAASLKHPNIVSVHSVGCERGVHYYAMEFIEGKTLADVIAALRQGSTRAADAQQPTEDVTPDGDGHVGGSLRDPQNPVSERPGHVKVPAAADTDQQARAETSTQKPGGTKDFFRRVAEWGIQAAEGLEHADQMGIVHRDVKPSNLLVDASGHLWITDFGLAQVQTDAGITMTGDILGTLRYMSPEQAAGRSRVLDHRTDIYSLGVTLYELLTLRPPFSGNDRQTVLRQIGDDEPPAPRQLNNAIPKDLETIVLKTLAKEPPARYATAQNLGDDLKRFLADEPIRARRPTLADRAAKWSRRHRHLLWTTAMAVTAVVLIGGVLRWRASQRAAQLEREVGEHLAAAAASVQSRDYAAADRHLADARGHLETGDYRRGPLADDVMRLGDELAAQRQAIARFDEFQQLRHRIHSEMYAVDRPILDQAQTHCRTALDLFGVQAKRVWKSDAMFRNLDSQRQAVLDEGAVELLFVWARLEIGRSDEQPEMERPAGHRRAIEALEEIESFHPAMPAVCLWMADSWEAVGDAKTTAEARARADSLATKSAMDYYLLGEHHVRQGRLEEALASYWQALTQNPEQYLALLASGVVLSDLQRYETAEAMLTGAIAMNPRTVLAYAKRGASRLEQGKIILAQADLRQARILDPDLARALTRRATANRLNLDFEKAVSDANEAIRLDPTSALAFAERSFAGGFTVDVDASLADAQQAVRLEPNNPVYYLIRAEAYANKGAVDKALADCDESIRLDPGLAWAYRTRGKYRTANKDWEKARADLEEAIRLETGNKAGVLCERGVFYRSRGELDEAIADFTEVIRLDPRHVWSFIERARIYVEKRDFEKAIADWNAAIHLCPKWGWILLERGATYQAKGEWDKALADYDEAIRLAPENGSCYAGRGSFYLDRRELEKAAADYDRAAELGPISWHFYKRAGLAHFQLQHYDKALKYIAKAVELNPGDGSNLWWIPPRLVAKCPDEPLRKGLLELADKAIEKTKGAAESYAARAMLYDAFGRYDEARVDFEKAFQLAPKGAVLWEWRASADAEHGRWNEVIADLSKFIESKPEGAHYWYRRALVRVAAGQAKEYRKDCDEMLQRFGQTDKADDANWVAWTCALAPDATGDWPTAITLAEKAAKSDPKSTTYQNTLGAVLYRAGQFEEAAKKLKEAEALVSAPSGTVVSSPAYSQFFLAMAQQRLHQAEDAKASFDKAVAETDKTLREHEQGIADAPWNRRLTLKLLRAEAQALLGISDTPPAEKEKTEGNE